MRAGIPKAEHVVPQPAPYDGDIVAGTSREKVVPGATNQNIVAVIAMQEVAAAKTEDQVPVGTARVSLVDIAAVDDRRGSPVACQRQSIPTRSIPELHARYVGLRRCCSDPALKAHQAAAGCIEQSQIVAPSDPHQILRLHFRGKANDVHVASHRTSLNHAGPRRIGADNQRVIAAGTVKGDARTHAADKSIVTTTCPEGRSAKRTIEHVRPIGTTKIAGRRPRDEMRNHRTQHLYRPHRANGKFDTRNVIGSKARATLTEHADRVPAVSYRQANAAVVRNAIATQNDVFRTDIGAHAYHIVVARISGRLEHRIRATTAPKQVDIVASPAVQFIVAGTTVQSIFSRPAKKAVVAADSGNEIGLLRSRETFAGRTSLQVSRRE